MTSEYPPVGEGLPESEPFEARPDEEVPAETEASTPSIVSEPSAPKPPVTGDQAVDEAMELVSDAFGAGLDFQLEAYEAAHQTLQDRLADVES